IVGGIALLCTLGLRRIGPALAAGIGLSIVGVGTLILKSSFPHLSISERSTQSFPSGHTGVAVVSAGILVALLLHASRRRNTIALIAAGIWGAFMAWGRLVILAHWLSDVIAGWSLGMIALIAALRVIDNPTPPRELVRAVVRRADSLLSRQGSAQPTPGDR
ncbi:MAG TPA: phosphatase PAP2 family protein, partial [Marmoricola sp.]|nr:phosphatase PAP2 family protein [Marmoricola sp.]